MSQLTASKAATPESNTPAKTRSASAGKKQRREFVFTANDTLGMLRTAIREMTRAGVKVSLVNGIDGALTVRIIGAQAVQVDGVTKITMREPQPAEPSAQPAPAAA